MRARVEELLKNHEEASQFIEKPAVTSDKALADFESLSVAH